MSGGTFLERARLPKATPAAPQRAPGTASTNSGPNSAYGIAGLDANLSELRAAPAGTRNHALNTAAFNVGQIVAGGELDCAAATDALTMTAQQMGLDAGEIFATVRSGLAAGADSPRNAPPLPDLALRPFTPHIVPSSPTDAPTAPAEIDVLHALKVTAEIQNLRVRAEARTLFAAEQAAANFRPPIYTATLTEELEIPDEPTDFAIDQLLPHGGNVLLTAQFKAGKTTTLNNLVRALADGEPFLDSFGVDPAPGRIAMLNYELDGAQYRRWIRDVGIRNTDNVTILNLRGYRLPITTPAVEDWLVDYLTERNVGTIILDPFARAATGIDENSNSEVGMWLDTLDVIKSRAGVRDLILATHTGRNEMEKGTERARGATRLNDWADVQWILTRDKNNNRFLRADGRDVNLPEALLTFDPNSRRLRYGGGDEAWVAEQDKVNEVITIVENNPGIGSNAIQRAMGGNKNNCSSALGQAIRAHRVRVQAAPSGNGLAHYATAHGFVTSVA